MRSTSLDAQTFEPFVREALPLATDEEVAAIVVRVVGRIVSSNEADKVRPGQIRLKPASRLALLRGFLSHVMTGRPGRGRMGRGLTHRQASGRCPGGARGLGRTQKGPTNLWSNLWSGIAL